MRADQFLYVNYVLQYVNGHAVRQHINVVETILTSTHNLSLKARCT